jgi:hypothetical protein
MDGGCRSDHEQNEKDSHMLSALTITLLIPAGLAYAFRQGHSDKTIVHRPYNNRYSDASGARDGRLG